CFPEFRSDLEQKNIEMILSNSWAKNFWNKIKEKSDDAEDFDFDSGEWDFYFKSKFEESSLRSNKATIFMEIENLISQISSTMTKKNLKQALIRAQKNNDQHEVKRILGLMQNFF
ncbi:MAG: hypothetical protein ABR542_02275, partial [Desulfonatronovibrio sp.]